MSFRLILSMSDSLNSSAGRTYLVLWSRFINILSQMCPICHQLWSHMTVCNKNILFSLNYNFICSISYAACNMLNHILELNLTTSPTEFIFADFKLVWSSTKVHKVYTCQISIIGILIKSDFIFKNHKYILKSASMTCLKLYSQIIWELFLFWLILWSSARKNSLSSLGSLKIKKQFLYHRQPLVFLCFSTKWGCGFGPVL